MIVLATTATLGISAAGVFSAQTSPDFIGQELPLPRVALPEGFVPIFDGRTLAGWHLSTTNHHGHTPEFFVQHGMIVGTQNPYGSGGILLSDRSYRDFELYLEVKPDWGNDSGLFLRSSEAGAAYQVTLDYLPGGSLGEVIGEGAVQLTAGAGPWGGIPAEPPSRDVNANAGATPAAIWKPEDWNVVRISMSGPAPRITVWINDVLVTEFQDTANSAAGGSTEGPIALQIHGANRWIPGGFWRWRNIGIRELP